MSIELKTRAEHKLPDGTRQEYFSLAGRFSFAGAGLLRYRGGRHANAGFFACRPACNCRFAERRD